MPTHNFWTRDASGNRVVRQIPDEQEVQNAMTNKLLLRNSGRVYGYSDERWISIHDDQYGSNYYQYAENAGTGSMPIDEWEHNGIIIPAGYKLKNFYLLGRTNSTQYTDLRICIKEILPNPLSRFATGYDSDVEITGNVLSDVLFKDMVQNQTGQSFSGIMNEKHLGVANIDHVFSDTCELRLYIKPVGNLTSTRYFYGTWTWEFE